MEAKKFSQFGTFSVAIMLPLFLLFIWLSIKARLSNSPDLGVYIFLSIVFLATLLIFYKLTISVDNKRVSFKLGIGLVNKSYKISEISSCRPVTNSILYGIGIRMLPNGWLYNVSGLQAVELRFNKSNSVIRIGTDKPDEVSSIIQSLLAGREDVNNRAEYSTKRKINPLLVLLLIVIAALVIIPNYQESSVNFKENEFKIKGLYGLTIPYSEIKQLDTVSDIPSISMRTNGYAFGKTLIGNFRFTDESSSKLFIKKGFPPYVLIRSKDRVPVYINFEDKQKTVALYNELKEHMRGKVPSDKN